MRFEKWQALGNDYLIFEEVELTAAQVRRLTDPHLGPGADGVLTLHQPDEPGFVARLKIFNPDGSEAELSGNGAREAILYLRRSGWTDADQFSIETAAGEIRPTITGPATTRVDMGRAHLTSKDFPSGGADGRGEVVRPRLVEITATSPPFMRRSTPWGDSRANRFVPFEQSSPPGPAFQPDRWDDPAAFAASARRCQAGCDEIGECDGPEKALIAAWWRRANRRVRRA